MAKLPQSLDGGEIVHAAGRTTLRLSAFDDTAFPPDPAFDVVSETTVRCLSCGNRMRFANMPCFSSYEDEYNYMRTLMTEMHGYINDVIAECQRGFGSDFDPARQQMARMLEGLRRRLGDGK